MAQKILRFTAGDRLPILKCIYKGINVTGFTITLHIGYKEPLIKPANITDGPAGEFQFEWAAGDLREGNWNAEVQVIDTDGKPITFDGGEDEFLFKIKRAIA